MPQIPNKIKYTSGITTSDTIKVKNFGIGMVDGGRYGPTSETNFWMGISPATSGYTIYGNKVILGPVIYGPQNDAELIEFAKKIVNPNITNISQALLGFTTGATDAICVNRDYESIVTDKMSLSLDAGFVPSYPRSGTIWYDLSYSGNNGTLTNGPTYNSMNGGSIVFDTVDDRINFTNIKNLTGSPTQDITMEVFVKFNQLDYVNNTGTLFWFWFYGGPDTLSASTNNGIWFSYDNRNNRSSFNYTCFGNTAGGFAGGGNNFGDSQYSHTFTNGSWNYIAFTISNNVGSLYINGLQKGSSKNFNNLRLSLSSTSSSIGFSAGGSTSPTPQISLIRQYEKALSSTEILQNFNAQKSRFGL